VQNILNIYYAPVNLIVISSIYTLVRGLQVLTPNYLYRDMVYHNQVYIPKNLADRHIERKMINGTLFIQN